MVVTGFMALFQAISRREHINSFYGVVTKSFTDSILPKQQSSEVEC